jgi:hypothetical protein
MTRPSSIRKHRANSVGDAGVTFAVLGLSVSLTTPDL